MKIMVELSHDPATKERKELIINQNIIALCKHKNWVIYNNKKVKI